MQCRQGAGGRYQQHNKKEHCLPCTMCQARLLSIDDSMCTMLAEILSKRIRRYQRLLAHLGGLDERSIRTPSGLYLQPKDLNEFLLNKQCPVQQFKHKHLIQLISKGNHTSLIAQYLSHLLKKTVEVKPLSKCAASCGFRRPRRSRAVKD